MSNPHTYEQIEEAIRKASKGGKYRLLLQRIIDGHKCRAYARIVTLARCFAFNMTIRRFIFQDNKSVRDLVESPGNGQ